MKGGSRRKAQAAPLLAALILLAAGGPAAANDHNNVDSGRPLSFDDAESIAFREQSFELGLGLGWPRRAPLGFGLHAEYLYGFAMNSHLSVGVEPTIGGWTHAGDNEFDVGHVSLGLFHNFNREYGKTPALSLRGDLVLPTERGSQGVGFRLRGIASRQADQYGRLHLNVDLNANPGAARGHRTFNPGVILGYTRPIGYPRRFDRTALAEIGVQAGPDSGTGPIITLGIGLRQQVSARSVVDVGLQSDVAALNGASGDRIRVIAGYSYGF